MRPLTWGGGGGGERGEEGKREGGVPTGLSLLPYMLVVWVGLMQPVS